MPSSNWGNVGDNTLEEETHGETVAHVSSVSVWSNVAEPTEDVSSCGLDGWANAAEQVDGTAGSTADASALPEQPLVLSDYAEPISRRRARPLQCFVVEGQVEASVTPARETVQHVFGGVETASGLASSSVVDDVAPRAQIDASALRVPLVRSFCRPAQHGHRPLSVCSLALQSAMEKSGFGTFRLDHDFYKVKSEYVDSGIDFHSCSLVVRAETMGMGEAELLRKLI
eukprot:6456288-Amphidinium_carterae.1